ncbi:3-hydroxyacyl-CoA dehydrogenase [Oleomonas cavernae]|uniref:enoyl-CoA hydratase n=1 Tax=Oleomonas cavernae TaxID=2320859 RepID=A0A418W8E4_9PROT|nr:3-hydroxyacyl-CoA dehydrogenase NAD-binding domain-containing protein [Oleomonas cavernae]RJF86280.1 3-hydroxyacyl-CoA dehydrogenase [Oleomonas cavernae]
MSNNINYAVDADGIATITWDMAGRSMNVLNEGSIRDFAEATEKAIADEKVKGVIITSAKDAFLAGADLDMLVKTAFGPKDAKALTDNSGTLQKIFRRYETSGKPFVAAINGTALGGGLEITLACHYRIAADNSRTKLGLPEVKVGLLPGAGGTQRLPRLIGAANALPLLLQGKELDPQGALGQGVVNEVVPAADLLARAKAYLLDKPRSVQPWDEKNFKIPGGGVYTPSGMQTFPGAIAMSHRESQGNYPAIKAILSCVYEGLQVPFDAGLRIETRYFVSLLIDPTSGNMIRTLFISMQELNKGVRRPAGQPATDVKKLGILGAGMMGAGIAYVSASAGIECVLLDQTIEAAEKGKAYSTGLLDKAISRGKSTEDKKAKLLGLIKPTTDHADLAGCDLVIEAVFENREVKAEATKKSEAVIPATSIYASNTSTLPISGLAEASVRPESFIGIHFFSPVDKMMLVEIIMGKKTDQRALAVAMDYVKKIKKTPIVVNDSRGFYTSRCFGTYVSEGIEMLAEGIAPAIIDNIGRATGMPRGPLEMNDDVALDLGHKVRTQTRKDLGDAYEATPADALVATLVEKLGRYGRKNGKGFYEYPADGKKYLWEGLADLAPVKIAESSTDLIKEIRTRLLFRQAVEAARCYAEGVVTDVRDADVGSILAWGFAPWTGGPLSLIDRVGVAAFVAQCDVFAQKYGKRYSPPQLLRDMAAKGETFYQTAKLAAAAE